jgi:hypothetical protein
LLQPLLRVQSVVINAITRASRAILRHAVGVSALVLMGAPSLVASFVLARWSRLALVADLAAIFALASTVFTAASFNLAQALTLWGVRDQHEDDFWLNRIVASLGAALLVLAVALVIRLDARIVVLAVLVKLTDAGVDLRFGLDTLRNTTEFATQRLLKWASARIAIFTVVTAAGLARGFDGVDALVLGAVVQLLAMQPWGDIPRARITRASATSAWRVARLTAHLSVSTTLCALLVSTPRIVTTYIASPRDLGFYGVTFMATTFIGMSFSLSWFRLASATRTNGSVAAIRHFGREGAALAVVLTACVLVSAPLIARIYAITDPRFYRIFPRVGVAFVIFYFFLCLANMLKTSSHKLLEASAYLTAAVVAAALTLGTHSLNAALVAASVTLATFTFFGVKDVRRAVTF